MTDPALDTGQALDAVPDLDDGPGLDADTLRTRVLASLTTARERTTLLTSCVEEPDLTAQHSP